MCGLFFFMIDVLYACTVTHCIKTNVILFRFYQRPHPHRRGNLEAVLHESLLHINLLQVYLHTPPFPPPHSQNLRVLKGQLKRLKDCLGGHLALGRRGEVDLHPQVARNLGVQQLRTTAGRMDQRMALTLMKTGRVPRGHHSALLSQMTTRHSFPKVDGVMPKSVT